MPSIHPDIHAAIDAEFARAYAKHRGKTPRSWDIKTHAADADHVAAHQAGVARLRATITPLED